jgi:hypothetical protein
MPGSQISQAEHTNVNLSATLVTLLWMVMAELTHGQGILIFSNMAGTDVDAPVSNAARNRIIGPAPDLFWSSDTNAPSESLTPAGFNQPFSTITLNGGCWDHSRPSSCVGHYLRDHVWPSAR